MNSIHLTAQLSDQAFADMLASSPRQVREVLFSKFHIKSDLVKNTISPVAKRFERARLLKERLGIAKSAQENQLCQELIRNWLFTKRPMLKAAMDFLNVPNDNGLVDSEENIFSKLESTKLEELKNYLVQNFSEEEVNTYLNFMQFNS